jgi:hypothetical protein
MCFRDRTSSSSFLLPSQADRGRRTRTSSYRHSVGFLLVALSCLTSCQTFRHQLAEPTPEWQSKIGQLQYRGPRTSLIGEVLVRYSARGEFELTFSKGPGVTLLTVRQDEKFVRVTGPLARGSWSGPPNEVPARLRGWVALRQLLLGAPSRPVVHQRVGAEEFTFAF